MTHFKPEECLTFVREVLSVLKSTNQYEKVLHLIVDRIVRIYRCQTCAVVVVDPKTEYLNIALSHGLSHTFSKEFRRKLATGATGKLLWTGKPVLIEDSTIDPHLAEDVKLENPFGSAVCIQITADHHTLGYLHVDSVGTNSYSVEDLPILQAFADFAGLALYKAQLFEENLRLDRVDHETELEKYAPFLERIHSSIERARTLNESFALMILDVDNFKHIALMYGYDSSRRMLKELAGSVKSRLRAIDAVGRHGIDELIVLRSNTTLEEGSNFAEELRRAVAESLFTDREIKTTVSVGVASFPQVGDSMDSLLKKVKEALYEAQRAGRNRVFSVFGGEPLDARQMRQDEDRDRMPLPKI
jgi:diguanylate cyclase (GGDEF)-like protein